MGKENEVLVISERGTDILPAIKKQIITYYHAYFPPQIWEGKDPEEWYEKDMKDPVRFVLLYDEAVISHAVVTTREIVHGDDLYQIAGLGGVLTREDCRGKGYGRKVVGKAMKYMRDQKRYDFGCLFCLPINVRFYERCGWEVLHNDNILVGPNIDESHPHDDSEVMMIYLISPKAKKNKQSLTNSTLFVGPSW